MALSEFIEEIANAKSKQENKEGESVIDLDEKYDEANQMNIRKLYCDVYAALAKDAPESASFYAGNAVRDYMRMFKPNVNKAPEGAKE